MSKVIASYGTPTAPFFAASANDLGTAKFSPLVQTAGIGGAIAKYMRVHGRLVAPTGGGSVVVRGTLIPDATKPADGSGSGNTLLCRATVGGSDTDSPSLAGTAATSFSATYDLHGQSGDSLPFPTRDVSLRLSNPTTAYTGGSVVIDTVELLD